jgi:hypothetical protein
VLRLLIEEAIRWAMRAASSGRVLTGIGIRWPRQGGGLSTRDQGLHLLSAATDAPLMSVVHTADQQLAQNNPTLATA